MDIYLVKTTLPQEYDCADAFVVQALNPAEAREMTFYEWGDHVDNPDLAASLYSVKLGVVTADLPQVQKVILRSFNAG